ncbi:MAG: hypothetical protein GXO92_02395 [FCB group bacterium]|nr:hypothetical protein [FCB group bacterium]
MAENNKLRWILFLVIGLCLGNAIPAQDHPRVTDLKIEVKRNGLYFQLHTSEAIAERNITAWATPTNWFYITILGAVSDTAKIMSTKPLYPVTEIQATNTANTTQLAFRIAKPIESFDFYRSDTPPEILFNLRFPIEEVVTALMEEKQDSFNAQGSDMEPEISNEEKIYGRVRNALYLAGTTLTVTGIISQDASETGIAWELPTGLLILSGTYLYDKYIHPHRKK